MLWLTAIVAIYGAFVFAGGVIGFVKGKSTASLVGGGGLGVVLLVAAGMSVFSPTPGFLIANVASVVCVVIFASRYAKTKAIFPAGIGTLLGGLTVLALGVGHLLANGAKVPGTP